MSLIQQALNNHSRLTAETITKDLNNLMSESEELKVSTCKYLEETQAKLHRPDTKRINILLENAISLACSLNDTKSKLSDPISSDLKHIKSNVQSMLDEAKKIDQFLSVTRDLNEKHKKLDLVKQLVDLEEYVKAANLLIELKDDVSSSTEIYVELHKQIVLQEKKLLALLDKQLKKQIQIKTTEANGLQIQTLDICCNKKVISEAVNASLLLHEEIQHFNDVVRFLWEHVFSNIVHFSSELDIKETKDNVHLDLKVHKDENKKDDLKVVFNNILKVADFLHSHYKISVSNDETTLDWLKDSIKDNLTELVTRFCLQETIPDSEDGLAEYPMIQNLVKTLQLQLISNGLLDSDSQTLTDYVSDVKTLYLKKKCKDLEKEALELVKKDLHDTVIVGEAVDAHTELTSKQFAQCAISKSTLQLLELIETIIATAATIQLEEHVDLYISLSIKIVSSYSDNIYRNHEKLLKTIPQQLGIFFNNCSFLSFQLQSEKFFNLFQSLAEGLQSQYAVLVNSARSLVMFAETLLDNYVIDQVKSIKSTIEGVNIPSAVDNLDPAVEKAVRQCLRQQELLKTVWQKVLGFPLYNRLLGSLLNTLTLQLVNQVLAFKDISMDVAEQLVEVLKIVLTRGPKLFADPKMVPVYVDTWDRLSEVVFILNADLLSIGERWADGKGPMALYLAPDEIKRLIKALFANSDRRAALLAKIN